MTPSATRKECELQLSTETPIRVFQYIFEYCIIIHMPTDIMRYKKIPLKPKTVKLARLLALAGDPTRLRILCFMFQYGEACVSDIAESLDMNITAVSHHLQVMRDNGYFETERQGNMICYTLKEDRFTKDLKKLVCG